LLLVNQQQHLMNNLFTPLMYPEFTRGSAYSAKGADKFFPEEEKEEWRHLSPLASLMLV